jgi:hypothetical protein
MFRSSSRARRHARETTPSTASGGSPARPHLLLERLHLLLEVFHLGPLALDRVDDVVGGHAQHPGHLREDGLLVAEALDGPEAGDRLEATDVRPDGALADDLHRADVAQGAHVGAAAELGGVRPRFEDAHDVAVLVAEDAMAPIWVA